VPNPGPASTVTTNTQATLAPIQTPVVNTNVGPVQDSNARRLIAVARSVPVSAAGDTQIQIINATSWSVEQVICTNPLVNGVSGTVATATLGLYTAPSQGGTAIVTTAALAGLTGTTIKNALTVASTAVFPSAATNFLYVNVVVTVANATVDVFVYGYDLS
jgi:hypothetical protein